MRYLIVFLTILSTYNLFSEDFQLWERQFSVEGGLRNAEFAGANDEFIVAYDNHHLYRFDTETSQMLDSIYYEKFVISSVISNDRQNYFINVEEYVFIIDVYTMQVKDTIPPLELSGKLGGKEISQRTTQINISEDDRLVAFTYSESNYDNENIKELIIYDLEKREVIARFGDKERDFRSQFYNPTFTPDAETLLVVVYRAETDFYEQENQIWFYDISEGKLITIGEKDQFKNKVQTNSGNNSDFIFLNDNEVYIYNSSLPNLSGFNVLNLESGVVSEFINFEKNEKDFSPRFYRYLENGKGLLTVFDNKKRETYLTIFNILERDTTILRKIVQIGANIYTNKKNTKFISFNAYSLWLNNLTKYLEITNINTENIISNINLSPNPSNSRSFSIQINSDSNIEVDINLYNITGQKVFDIKKDIFIHNGNNEIDFNIPLELPSGQYFLRIESERGSQDVKIQF